MAEDLKSYPHYKQVEIPWLEVIPNHWGTKRAKWIFTKMDRPVRAEDEVVTCFRDGTVTLRKLRRLNGFTESLKEIGYQGIRNGDLVIHQMDAFAGAVGVSDSDGKGTPVYSVCVPINKMDSTYYYAAIVKEMARSEYILSLSKGIRERSCEFRFDTFKNQTLPYPPAEEQAKIACYIKWKTSQINKFLKAKMRMIELLKEQKQVVINDVVTGKIDVRIGKPYLKYKETGEELLGKIPEHWSVRKLKHCIRFLTDFTSNGSFGDLAKNVVYRAEGYARLVRLTDLRENFDNNGVYIDEDAYEYLSKSKLFGGEFLIANVGAYAGYSFLVPKKLNFKASLGPNMYVIYYNDLLDNEYAYFLTNSKIILRSITLKATATAQPKLNKDNVKEIRVPLPPISDQKNILEYLYKYTAMLNEGISRVEKEINLMHEFKKTLINNVVTGRVDIRKFKIPQFEYQSELNEPENASIIVDNNPDQIDLSTSDTME